jgi:hypothetical protein
MYLDFRSYPSWLFKESSPLSSMNTSLSEPDLRTSVEDKEEEEEEGEGEEGESEDEGWYSLSRTDLRKLQVEGKGGGVNLVLTNCGQEEGEAESSQERNSYRLVSPPSCSVHLFIAYWLSKQQVLPIFPLMLPWTKCCFSILKHAFFYGE